MGDEGTRRRHVGEHASDVDATMLRGIRSETPLGLLELTLAAPAVCALRMEPRYRDVDEPLEEVTLLGRRGSPLVLEFLVGVEVPPSADQLQPSSQAHRS